MSNPPMSVPGKKPTYVQILGPIGPAARPSIAPRQRDRGTDNFNFI